MELYGYPEPIYSAWKKTVVSQFHYTPRPDSLGFRDGDVFDLGGARVRVIHAPGHTRGHCVFHVEPDDLVYLADIDLSSFGPYYGDAWSDLEDFERTSRGGAQARRALVRDLPPHRRDRGPRGLPGAARAVYGRDRGPRAPAFGFPGRAANRSPRSPSTASCTGRRTRFRSPRPSSAGACRSTSRGSCARDACARSSPAASRGRTRERVGSLRGPRGRRDDHARSARETQRDELRDARRVHRSGRARGRGSRGAGRDRDGLRWLLLRRHRSRGPVERARREARLAR